MGTKRTSIGSLTCALLVLVQNSALANALAKEPERTIIRAGQMVDVRNGALVKPAILVIAGDRIESVNPQDLPPGAKSIDLPNSTLLPGLMDLHTHLTLDLEGDWLHIRATQGQADSALRGARNAKMTLLAGFTTVREAGSDGADVALARAVEKGWVEGPRIFPVRNAVGITGGHCDQTAYRSGVLELGPHDGVANGVDEVIKAVRYQIKHGAQWIKICATSGVLSLEGTAGAREFNDDELRAIVDEANRHGVRVMAHAHGTEGIIAAVKSGVKSIEHGSVLNQDAIRQLKKHGAYLVPTVYSWVPPLPEDAPLEIHKKNEQIKAHVAGSVRAASRAGVRIALGTDAGTFPHGQNAREFHALVELGMSPIEAIQAATINARDLLGVHDRGVLAPGLLADIIAVNANPLEDVRALERVSFVMKGGKVVKGP